MIRTRKACFSLLPLTEASAAASAAAPATARPGAAAVDPIAPGASVTVHGGVNLRGGFRSSRGGVLDVVIGDREIFPADPPARVSMVAGLTIDARVEIDVVAGMRKTTRR